MKGASVEAQKYAVNIKNGTGSAQTFATNQKAIQTSVTKTGVASKVAAVGLNIFKTALNMGIMLGVSELITGVIELATYSDKLADSAQSLGNDFKDSENDISDYKDRIQELNDKINDSSTPYADVIQARKDLMTIQNEMIEKYGDEKGAIEDITNAIKGQADAFNNLNMTQYNKMVNDFNKTGGIVGKIQNAFVGSNFEQMKKDEKSYSDKIDMSYNSDLDDYIKSLGAKQVISDRGSYFELNGTLEEVYEKMQSIQEVANQLGEDKYANRLSDQINDAKELTDKYKDMYDAYVLYEQVLKDTDYSSAYQKAMSDYQNYQKQATENGFDSEEAKKASEQYAQNMSEAIQKALENGDDEVADYFESLYPDLQSIVETWKFKAKITPEWDDGSTNDNYDKETDKEMKEALGVFNNAEEIKNFNSDTATKEQENAMTTLQKIAEQNFHNDIDALVDAAIALYGLETQGEQDFIDKLNGKSLSNNKKRNQEDLTAGASATMSNATSKSNTTSNNKVDNKTAKEFYNSLTSDEDKALVVSDDFNRVLAQQTGTLENGKYSVNSYTNALKQLKDAQDGANGSASELSISDAITKIDDLQTKMKDLDGIMADFVSGDGIDVSNLSGIVDSFQKMKDAGQDVDMTNVENAIKQISDASSLNEAQSALDSLCTEYVYASGVLDGLTDSNASLIAERLKGIGVANAEQIVEQQLEAQKLATKVETEGLTEATLAEIQAYMDEQGYSEQAQQALYQLLLTKIDIANNPINTASDIQQLINLANAAGTASNYVEKLQRLLNMMNGINTYTKAATDINDAKKQQRDEQAYYRHAEKQGKKSNGKYETVDEYALAKANEYAQAIKNVTQTKLNANNFITKPHYGGGSSTRSAQNKANKSGGSGSSGGGSGSEKEPTKKDYDWIETLISRINRQVSNLGKTVSATYKTWSTRNNALAQELGSVNQQISAEQQAYNKYMQLANSVGLPEGYASLVRNGTIDVSTIQDDDLNDKIEKYQNYYNKAIEASDAVQDLQDKLAELAKTKFDNVNSEYEAQLKQIDHSINMYDKMIDTAETQGYIASQKYYNALISTEGSNISKLQLQYSSLTSARNEAMKAGNIAKYSEEWYSMTDSINSVEEAIQDANKSLIEYKNNLRQVNWNFFDKQEDYISKLQDESDWFINLITTENKLFNSDNGKITSSGKAVEGLHAINYNAYMTQANDYAKEIKKIDAEIANDPANTTLIERRQELLEQQRDMIKSAEDEKSAIKDLVSDGYDALSEALKKIADNYLDALNAQEDLYDYAKTIREQTKAVAQYEKQLEAIKNDTSEETKAQIQQIKVKLEDAKQDLADSEYNQWISDQQNIVDTFESELEDWINSRLDDLDELVQNVIDQTNTSASEINDVIEKEAGDVGYTVSDAISKVMDVDSTNGTNMVNFYDKTFPNEMTTTRKSIDAIKNLLQAMKDAADKKAQEEIKKQQAAQQAISKPASSSSSSSSSSSNSHSSNNSGSSSSSSGWGSWFVHKADSYPKSKLRINSSIVDRLKLHNFDSSKSARAGYYKAMGGSGTYVGSASQNNWMISEMKKHGFKQGGTIGKLIRSTGEDGFVLARTGEEILSKEKLIMLKDALQYIPQNFNIASTSLPKFTQKASNSSVDVKVDFGGITMNGVNNPEEFVTELQKSKRFEKIVQSITVDTAMGKNSLGKYKF